MNSESKMTKQGPCPKCQSSDAFTLYDDGHGYCFSCEFYKGTDMQQNNIRPAPIQGVVQTNFSTGIYSAIFDRKIKETTAKKYNVLVNQDTNSNISQHIYKYYDSNNSHVANKLRNTNDKEFWAEGSIKDAGLFGQNLFPAGGKYVTLTEGEIDAMSIYQMMGEKWAAVSIKTGAAGAVRDCKASYEYLNKFDNIVICFDSDESGLSVLLAFNVC